ncbi:MAG: glycosyltransferase family 2 protein, partial [Candidatus Sungiibacteriota bacterium]
MIQKHKISVVIPTKNEERTIQEIVEGCRKYGDEVLVIDGHSLDKTRERAAAAGAKVMLDNGRGKGAALRLAIKEAHGDIIVFIDADGSHDPADIPKIINPIIEGGADMVIGSRLKGGSDELGTTFSEVLRLYGGRFLALVINLRFRQNITD